MGEVIRLKRVVLGLVLAAIAVGCEPAPTAVPTSDAQKHQQEKRERDGHYSRGH